MKNIKVLILDKELLARRGMANVLQNDINFDIITSEDLEAWADLISKQNPDVLLLDLEQFANIDVDVITEIRSLFPQLPIVATATRTARGAELVVKALKNGVVDFISKPEKSNSMLFAERHFKKRLIPIIKTAASFHYRPEFENQSIKEHKSTTSGNMINKHFRDFAKLDFQPEIIVIGAGCGGPDVLFNLIPKLSENLSVPVVIVQHFPRNFTKQLAIKLDNISKVRVEEAYDGIELNAGMVWLVPGGYHGEIKRQGIKNILNLHRGPRENENRPSIDILFRSASRVYGKGVLAAVLSSCGNDGLEGAKIIKDNGGVVLIQAPYTTFSPSLPLQIFNKANYNISLETEELVELLNKIAIRKIDSTRKRLDKTLENDIRELYRRDFS